MIAYRDEIVEEVHRTRANLLKKYGGIDGLHKHMEEERPLLEAQGWKFVTPEEVRAEHDRQAASLS
jgi:predicted type IV restriction endonuclease